MRVLWSARARGQVVEIFEYVVRDRPQTAEAMLERLIARVELLSDLPEQSRAFGDGERHELREIVFESYRLVYRVGSEQLSILSIRHAWIEEEDPPRGRVGPRSTT